MKKEKFIQQINYSHCEGGLTCSFNDYQLAEFIQHQRCKTGRLPVAIISAISPRWSRSKKVLLMLLDVVLLRRIAMLA